MPEYDTPFGKITSADGVEFYRTDKVAPMEIVRNLGMVVATAQFRSDPMDALNACATQLSGKASDRGANAVIALSLDTGTTMTGMGATVHVLYMSGDAVILMDE